MAEVSKEQVKETIIQCKEMDYCSSSSSSSSSSEVVYPTRHRLIKSRIKPHLIKYYRRPLSNVPFIPSIRVLKRDIRRRYVEMMSNVMNSHDAALFSSFIDDFYHPNFCIYYSSPPTVQHFFKPLHLKGRETVKTFLSGSFFLVPDEVEVHSDIKICKGLNESGSRIVGNMEKTGTIIYIPKKIHAKPVDRNNSLKDCLPSLDEPPPPVRNHEDVLENFQLSQKPLRVKSCSKYQIVLDENHRMLSLHVYYYDVTFTPLPFDQIYRE